jgi:hypothetical protein
MMMAVWVLGSAAIVWLVFRRGREVDADRGRRPLSAEPLEPGWTEAMFTDGRYIYGRAFSVHDSLMELDALARLGEYPIRVGSGE